MIGDTFTIRQASSSPWATLPGQTSNSVILRKVNQDAYGAEYRFNDDVNGRYILKVRNSIEPATAVKPAYNRHNVELSFYPPLASGVQPPPIIDYFVCRVPQTATVALKDAIYYALCVGVTQAVMEQIFNFES